MFLEVLLDPTWRLETLAVLGRINRLSEAATFPGHCSRIPNDCEARTYDVEHDQRQPVGWQAGNTSSYWRWEADYMERRTQIRVVLTALVAFLPVTTIVIAPGASAAPAPIKIALITDLTGPGGPIYSTSPSAFDARIDLQNAEGGVNGHKLVPLVIDDQTSPTAVMTAVQDALSRGALGIVSTSGVIRRSCPELRYGFTECSGISGPRGWRRRVAHGSVATPRGWDQMHLPDGTHAGPTEVGISFRLTRLKRHFELVPRYPTFALSPTGTCAARPTRVEEDGFAGGTFLGRADGPLP